IAGRAIKPLRLGVAAEDVERDLKQAQRARKRLEGIQRRPSVTPASEGWVNLDLEQVGDPPTAARQGGEPQMADGVAVGASLDVVEMVVGRSDAVRKQALGLGARKLHRLMRQPAA